MYINSIGIQVKSLRSCIAVAADGQFKIDLEYQSNEDLQNVKSAEEANTSRLKIQSYTYSNTDCKEEFCKLQMIELEGQEYSPQKIMQIILENLRSSAQEVSGIKVDSVAYSIPSHFGQTQQQIVEAAGTMANLTMQIIDLHYATVIAFSMVQVIKPDEKVLIFDLSDEQIQVTIMVLKDDEFSIENKIVTKFNLQIINKSKIDELWNKYGISTIRRVQYNQNELRYVLLVGEFAEHLMNHLKSLFMQYLENKDVHFYINPCWAIAQGAALMLQRQIIQKRSKIQQLGVPMSVDQVYQGMIQLSQQKQNILINQMKTEQKQLYRKYCIETDHFKDKEYKQKFSLLNLWAQKNKLIECNQLIQSCFDKDNNRGYTLYLNLVGTITGLKNPYPDDSDCENNNSQILKELQSQIPPIDCEQSYQSLLDCIQGQCGQEVVEFLSDIYEKDEPFFQIIASRIYSILPQTEQIFQTYKKNIGLRRAIKSRGIYTSEVSEILQNLLIGKLVEGQKLFEHMLRNQLDQAIILLNIIGIVYPEFDTFEETICIMMAPENIKRQASELFNELKKEQQRSNKDIELILQDIFNEGILYYQKLFQYLQRQYPSILSLELPQSYEDIYKKSQFQISRQLVSNQATHYNKLQIKDFMTVNAEFDTQSAEIDIVNFFRQENRLESYDICTLLFDYIKKKCNFQTLIDKLSKNQTDFYLTKSILFNVMMKNSNTYLRTMIFMACSTFMPVPLLSYDWEDSKILVWKELFYTFEKRKAVITFKLSTNVMKGPQGCTTFINSLFNKEFEKHNSKFTNFGSIDLQFDYNFAAPLYVPVADTHGYLDSSVLRRFYNLFNIFIIHIMSREQDRILLDEEIKEIHIRNKSPLIIVIEHDLKFAEEQYQIQQNSDQYFTVKSKPYTILQEQVQINLKDEILEIVLRDLSIEQNYIADTNQRIESMQQFIELLRQFELDDRLFNQGIIIIESFIELVKADCHNLCSKQFLPLNYVFQKRCSIYNTLKQESEMTSLIRERLTQQLIQLDSEIKDCGQARVVEVFCQIIEFKNFLGLSSVVAKLLKGYLGTQIKPLIEQKTRLRGSFQSVGLTQYQRDNLFHEMNGLTQSIENKCFSNEHVIRELYLLSANQKQIDSQYRVMYTELAELQINQGQPFELIDGNNLQFVKGIYDQIYQDIDESVLVVSVIGPQSSGKSLLLNYLFGTQFQSAAGRCTKGVYGTILELNSSCQQIYKKILLLDTEGLQSMEGRDDKFDKRIVFFILCVSNVVLICNKGEMNHQMSEIIKLATDAISNLKEARVHGMSVNIVMNMLAHTDEVALEECITKLSEALIEIQGGNNQQQLFHICKENIFLLPFIYDSKGHDLMKVLQPSSDLASRLEPLKKKILDQVYYMDPSNHSIYTLKEQFLYAEDLWTFTESFKGIFDYKNLEQKREDLKLLDKMNFLIEEHFVINQEDHICEINKIIQKVITQYQGSTVEINKQFAQMFQKITIKIQQELDKFCGENYISLSIRDKRSNFLLRSMNKYYTEWINISNTQLAIYTQKKSKTFGDERLQKHINIIMAQNEVYTDQQAIQKFHESWQDVQEQIVQMFKTRESVTNEIFDLINGYYENEIFDNVLKDNDQEYQELQSYKKMGTLSLHDFFILQQPNLFYFVGDQVKPNKSKIIALQEKDKMFLVNLKENLFLKTQFRQCFEWERLVKDTFDLDLLMDDIYSDLTSNKWFILKQVRINQIKIRKIINQLQVEAHQYDLEVRIQFISQLLNLEKTLLQQQKESIDQKITDVSLLLCLFSQYRIYVKENNQLIFKYKKQIHKGHCKFRYFQKIQLKDYKTEKVCQIDVDGVAQLSNNIDIEFNENYFPNDQVDLHLIRYFKFLENRQDIPINPQSQEAQKARQFFFQQLNTQNIIRQIETIVLQDYKRDGQFEHQTVHEWMLDIAKDTTQRLRREFCRVDRKIVQSIIMNVKNLITQMDDELEPFCFKVSEHGCQALHLIGKTFINALAEELEYNELIAPIQIWKDSEDIQKNIFVAKLTSNDKEMDTAVAYKTAVDVSQLIVQRAKDTTIEYFHRNMLIIKKEFNKNKVISRLEEFAIRAAQNLEAEKKADHHQLIQINELKNLSHLTKEFGFTLNEVVAFYVHPRDYLQKKFLLEWGEQTKSLLYHCKIQYVHEIMGNIQIVTNYFNSLKQQLEIKNVSLTALSLFINKNELIQGGPMQTTGDRTNQDDSSKAQSQYLIKLLRGDWHYKSIIQIQGGSKLACGPNIFLPLPEDVGRPPNDYIVQEIVDHLEYEKISKLDNFISEFVNQLQKQNINELEDVEIIGNLLQDFKNTFVGCNEYCPLCRRECDQSHDEAELVNQRIHSCQQGHQYQCFGGSRLYGSNEALTYGCDAIQDNDQIYFKEKQLKWSDFKKLFPQWDFMESERKVKLNNAKNAKIWNLIGPYICQYYQNINIEIKFVPADSLTQHQAAKQVPSKVHYLLLLDRSGSMKGARWQHLISAVRDFLLKLDSSQIYRDNSRVSIIGHDQYSEKICQNSIPSIKLIDLIKFTGGNNNFNLPLQMALTFMEESFMEFDKFVLCFMSDGGSHYPQIAIKKILSSIVYPKIVFHGIGYGEDRNIEKVMRPMVIALDGTMVIGLTPQELSSAFRRIIPNTYEQ